MPQLDFAQTYGRQFLAFSPDTTAEQARTAFRQRYGADPELIGRSLGNNVLAGPIPEVGR